mmetsp:Transcript_89166/g.238038  ORF Transcript_89166/g.238038 Transcript_89166/m.238038 type:complete len:340 (-) Transcript_89166:823-1842(-)
MTRTIIISSGDISDVDGFFAISHYAKTGADVLFVMNYPGYIAIKDEILEFDKENPGLGYRYSSKTVFDSTGEPSGTYKKYLDIYKRGIDTSDSANATMHEAMTDLAFIMANRVWNEVETEEGVTKGRLFFAIGGVNDVNPFSGKAVKNEVYVYTSGENKSNDKPLLTAEDIRVHGHIEPTEGNVYSSDGSKVDLDLAAYGAVYMDFNGSMALFSSAWERNLDKLATEKKLKGVFVMGGVLAEAAPLTMPSIPGVLNRFSSATMNQLYHPARTASFFDLLARHPEVPVFTVTNNAVGDLLTMNSSKEKTMEGVWAFMDSNGCAPHPPIHHNTLIKKPGKK